MSIERLSVAVVMEVERKWGAKVMNVTHVAGLALKRIHCSRRKLSAIHVKDTES